MATATDPAPHAEPPTADLLRVTQWLSPAFPVSTYAYSHGLEAEIAAGRVADAADTRAWVAHVLQRGSGFSDAVLLIAARSPDADLAALADLARALAAGRERLDETEAQGRAMAETLAGLGRDIAPAPYPITLGAACRDLDLPDAALGALYLQAFAAMLVSAAVRFVPLGQVAGQRVLQNLHPVIADTAARAARTDPADITQSAFGADLAALEHETLPVRIFRS